MVKLVREPFAVTYREAAGFKDTYGGAAGQVFLECLRICPEGSSARTAVVFSHPVGGGAWLPMISALARAGVHCVYVNPRYRGNDSALIMEKCVADLGAGIAEAKRRYGYDRIVLGGWSGGGSLSLFYQDQAECPRLTETPAGDPYHLHQAGLVAADGIMLLAAHVSRAVTLSEWIDPSITDEARPVARDPQLDLYAPDGPRPPFSSDFLARYRAAQKARIRRITDWVKQTLSALRSAGDTAMERGFVTHGTMADPRFLDPAIDPSDRRAGECYLGTPRIVNDGPVGLARFSTLRSWLSQWSLDDTNADGLGNGGRISCPVLVINNTADLACTPSHARRLHDALSGVRRTYRDIQGADHYYIEAPDLAGVAAGHCRDWLEQEGLI